MNLPEITNDDLRQGERIAATYFPPPRQLIKHALRGRVGWRTIWVVAFKIDYHDSLKHRNWFGQWAIKPDMSYADMVAHRIPFMWVPFEDLKDIRKI